MIFNHLAGILLITLITIAVVKGLVSTTEGCWLWLRVLLPVLKRVGSGGLLGVVGSGSTRL